MVGRNGSGGQAGYVPAPADRRRWWNVSCRDVSNRHRNLAVLIDRDKVVLVGSPGRATVFNTGGVRELSMALRDAADQARK